LILSRYHDFNYVLNLELSEALTLIEFAATSKREEDILNIWLSGYNHNETYDNFKKRFDVNNVTKTSKGNESALDILDDVIKAYPKKFKKNDEVM
jgi:hypothetical protein